MIHSKATILMLLLLCAFVMRASTASAQSTVFNIASTEVQMQHKIFVEADFLAHLTANKNGGYQIFGTRVVYGLSKRTEIGLNAFYTRTSPAAPVEIQPNFKLQLYSNEGNGVNVAVGTVVYIPVTRRSSTTTRGMVYAVASKSFKGDRAPRLTAGGYTLVGSFEDGTSKHGVLLGYEQPLTRRLAFVSDWSSGNNDLGYLAVGLGITLSPKSVVYVGYNFGNNGRGNNALGVFYGFSF